MLPKSFKSQKRAHLIFQKPIEWPSKFQKLRENSSIFINQWEKRKQKIRKRIQPIRKWNQPTDALAGFKKCDEIQKLKEQLTNITGTYILAILKNNIKIGL